MYYISWLIVAIITDTEPLQSQFFLLHISIDLPVLTIGNYINNIPVQRTPNVNIEQCREV